jgi:hypothetical protein
VPRPRELTCAPSSFYYFAVGQAPHREKEQLQPGG